MCARFDKGTDMFAEVMSVGVHILLGKRGDMYAGVKGIEFERCSSYRSDMFA